MARRQEAAALYDERFCRMWEYYLSGAEAVFRVGCFAVFQFQLAHNVGSVPLTRDYIGERESDLRGRDSVRARYAACGGIALSRRAMAGTIGREKRFTTTIVSRSAAPRDPRIEPTIAVLAKGETLVEEDDFVPLRALRFVHGQRIAEIELVGAAAQGIGYLFFAVEELRQYIDPQRLALGFVF